MTTTNYLFETSEIFQELESKRNLFFYERCVTDPIYFIEMTCIQNPLNGAIPFILYDYQKNLINTYKNNRSTIVLASRQCGKTTLSSHYLLWEALFKNDQNIMIATPKSNQGKEILERILFAYHSLPKFLQEFLPKIIRRQTNFVQFDNGSQIVFRAFSTSFACGFSLNLLYIDELAFCNERQAKEAWAEVQPTLAIEGRCIIASSANSTGLFYDLWNTAHQRQMARFEIKYNDHPDRDEQWAEYWKKGLGENIFAREYLNHFQIDYYI